jgi:hypothetical protein
MMSHTLEIIRTALKADSSVASSDRARLLATIRNGGSQPPESVQRIQRIVRRTEAARMYGCSLRLIDRLAAQGVLEKVRLPGRKRGAGFRESDLLALIAGKEAA